MTRIEEIEANVAEAKTRQDVNDSGLLAVLIASDIPYLIAENKRLQEELNSYKVGDFNNQENIAVLEAEVKRMREALELIASYCDGGFIKCERCGDQTDMTDCDMHIEVRAALKGIEP